MPTRLALGERKKSDRWLVAVAGQRSVNHRLHRRVDGGGSAQVTTAFFRHTGRQVAGARVAVHRFSGRRQAETLLGSLVGFDFGFSFGFGHFRIAITKIRDVSGTPLGLE